MIDQNTCRCESGHAFDPTLAFQKSACCNASLARKTYHYACSRCKKTNPSRFLFDERHFDAEYFREMMQASRERSKKQKEAKIKQMLQDRSSELLILDEPRIEQIPGLVDELDAFIGTGPKESDQTAIPTIPELVMDDYRTHILNALDCGSRLFSAIRNLADDVRKDRAFRFATVVYMQHEKEVELTQLENDLLIECTENETYK